MGCGASVSPAEKTLQKAKLKAMRAKTNQSTPSDFYCACRDGNINYVKAHIDDMSQAEINKVEPNGDTALHVATRNEHREIVQLLLQSQCSRVIFNKEGKMPHEEVKSPETMKLFERPTAARFHESNAQGSLDTFKPADQELTEETTRMYTKTFKSKKELENYTVKQQTTAMWLKFFSVVTNKFGGLIRRTDFRPELFDLEHDRDFNEFLKQAIKDQQAYDRVVQTLKMAEAGKDVKPLIRLYTSEFGPNKKPFYEILNEQLAIEAENQRDTAHFCDRFVYEFEMKRSQLEEYAFIGNTFRGISMTDADIEGYVALSQTNPKGAIATKTFTSTSKLRKVALEFAYATKNDKRPVILNFHISKPCSGIVDVTTISDYPKEEEVLIIPDNLFDVVKVSKDCDPIEIHLEHLNTEVSTFQKVAHTITASRTRIPRGKALAEKKQPNEPTSESSTRNS